MTLAATYRARAHELIENVLILYDGATADEKHLGHAWYPLATELLSGIAAESGFPLATIASATAAMSPQISWERNVRAIQLLTVGHVPIDPLRVNVEKAVAILRDRATLPDKYFIAAPKVCAFARNLQGDSSVVTIDTHMLQAIVADPASLQSVRPTLYPVLSDIVVSAAKRCHVAPCALQATVWLVWKRVYSPERKRVIRRRW